MILLNIPGVLVEAMRHGYWIILDELNLAPSDVLEALNRVLDDNRELYIPETQTTVKADTRFRLFATQNPPGMYGGRKVCKVVICSNAIHSNSLFIYMRFLDAFPCLQKSFY